MKFQFEHILLIFFLLLVLYYLSRCNCVCGIDGFSVGVQYTDQDSDSDPSSPPHKCNSDCIFTPDQLCIRNCSGLKEDQCESSGDCYFDSDSDSDSGSGVCKNLCEDLDQDKCIDHNDCNWIEPHPNDSYCLTNCSTLNEKQCEGLIERTQSADFLSDCYLDSGECKNYCENLDQDKCDENSNCNWTEPTKDPNDSYCLTNCDTLNEDQCSLIDSMGFCYLDYDSDSGSGVCKNYCEDLDQDKCDDNSNCEFMTFTDGNYCNTKCSRLSDEGCKVSGNYCYLDSEGVCTSYCERLLDQGECDDRSDCNWIAPSKDPNDSYCSTNCSNLNEEQCEDFSSCYLDSDSDSDSDSGSGVCKNYCESLDQGECDDRKDCKFTTFADGNYCVTKCDTLNEEQCEEFRSCYFDSDSDSGSGVCKNYCDSLGLEQDDCQSRGNDCYWIEPTPNDRYCSTNCSNLKEDQCEGSGNCYFDFDSDSGSGVCKNLCGSLDQGKCIDRSDCNWIEPTKDPNDSYCLTNCSNLKEDQCEGLIERSDDSDCYCYLDYDCYLDSGECKNYCEDLDQDKCDENSNCNWVDNICQDISPAPARPAPAPPPPSPSPSPAPAPPAPTPTSVMCNPTTTPPQLCPGGSDCPQCGKVACECP